MTVDLSSRPRRSALYMPASNAKAVEKARTLDADVIILDLEDAVAPEAKPAARDAAVAAVQAGGFGSREVVIRVNGLDTPWGAEDLAAAAEAGPDAVLVPKVNDAADVRLYDQRLHAARPATRLWTMIETAKAAFHLWEIAEASHGTRLSAWVMGVNDFAKEMRARQTPDRAPFLPLLTLSVAAARAHGLTILDGVHNDIEDLAALEAVCVQGVDFGFDGKTLIHPKHLEICNRVFSPSPEDIAWSRAVIAAFNAPENSGKGALRVDGKMAERLHLAQAERLVAVAEAIAARG
ncbi:CoA ester lyase [Caulobacter segnis]|uniref:CoA ester lyase n=1 Tax=Caulobacter segnis TaxID=88688 RepID=A0A2W5WAM7_9CAUL|nr:CoA ester lyase [Caulobacter segnis]PZR30638.1 MAG: CoA ester lyase [Caulobacter segnis]